MALLNHEKFVFFFKLFVYMLVQRVHNIYDTMMHACFSVHFSFHFPNTKEKRNFHNITIPLLSFKTNWLNCIGGWVVVKWHLKLITVIIHVIYVIKKRFENLVDSNSIAFLASILNIYNLNQFVYNQFVLISHIYLNCIYYFMLLSLINLSIKWKLIPSINFDIVKCLICNISL